MKNLLFNLTKCSGNKIEHSSFKDEDTTKSINLQILFCGDNFDKILPL